MVKDHLAKFRTKTKMIFEVRYQSIFEAFDNRGKVSKALNKAFKEKLPISNIGNVEITQSEEAENSSKNIYFDHRTMRLIYEDPDSLTEFVTDVDILIGILFDIFGKGEGSGESIPLEFERIGVRFQSIFSLPGLFSFEEVRRKIQLHFLNPKLPLTINIADMQLVFRHDNGQIILGPAKADELWVKNSFAKPNVNVPKHGLGVDIDSFILKPDITSAKKLLTGFETTMVLTMDSEREMVNVFDTTVKLG